MMKKYYHEGELAFKADIHRCPYPDGTPESDAWREGWNDAEVDDEEGSVSFADPQEEHDKNNGIAVA
jgi:hypothetical protein